ncbi:MAG: hypothetical protein AAB834_06030 [Patescibacteria group bacterium]
MTKKEKRRKQAQLIKELEDNPIVERACRKAGVPRSNYYRWCDQDPAFKHAVKEAQNKGRDKLNDFVESKLLENIDANLHHAITFWLRHNSRHYRPHAIRLYLDENKKQEHELGILKALLNELIDKVGIDEAIRIAGYDPVKFRMKIEKELKAQDKPPDEL